MSAIVAAENDGGASGETLKAIGQGRHMAVDARSTEEKVGGGGSGGGGASRPRGVPSPLPPQRSRTSSADISAMYGGYNIPPSFDYSRSTEDNYSTDAAGEAEPLFVGKHKEHRAKLDYSFHKHYRPERQVFHDKLMDMFHDTHVFDGDKNLYCDRPLENWIVFTAGPMGAGKGHTMQWLQREGLFPLAAFVKVDPDSLRELLPETPEYITRDPHAAGALTQKEVGYIAEVLSMDALDDGKNVLVDGSLKDAVWYQMYINSLRSAFPRLKIAIIHVTASEATILGRCRTRAETTGRVVPEAVIQSAIEQIPNTLRLLSPKVDYFATFENEDGLEEPRLLQATKSVSTNDLAALVDAAMNLDSAGERRPEYVYEAPAGGGGDEWRRAFQQVWKMECALPVRRTTSSPASSSAKGEL